MKRRWWVAASVVGLLAAVVVVPIGYIEIGCRAAPTSTRGNGFHPSLSPAERRPEARTYLTYPEWHIVYEADAFARHLALGRPPSSFAYGSQIATFWTSYCAVNRKTAGSPSAGAAKVMIYTIGISFTLELALKAAYERTVGQLFERLSGWTSADDRYAAGVQRRYGAFMHETPWYRFPFATALAGAWYTDEPSLHARHWERRFALSSEYGVKAIYAKAIDQASGAALGRDETVLRFVATASPAAIQSIDPRLHPVRMLANGNVVVEAPRYQQFNALLTKMSRTDVRLVEIAGNNVIFATLLLPDRLPDPPSALLVMPIERAGWRRVGVSVTVPNVIRLLRETTTAGGIVEHVYDY